MAKFKDVLEIVREDDFVEYFIFQNNINIDQLNKADILSNTKSHIQSIINKYQSGYIWQKDEFNLIPRNTSIFHPVDDNEEILPAHLYGVTHYGDNIEDEWFIVFLLVQITKEIPGIIARVIDSDGEFLLIEAADFLPKWATPETCDKRVYIYNGEVHIIPVSKENSEDENLTVNYALQRIISQPEMTRANISIQKAVKARIEGYPEKITKNLHHANLYVPAAVAALLKEKPSLVAAAVTAFTYRDPIDMRACRVMRYFPPETRVMCRVTFTKCLYAMLVYQKFIPDRRTGWNLPPSNTPLHKAHSLGVKLACGFEILASQYRTTDNNNDLSTDRGWHRYKQSLQEKGYFKDLLEGSQEYSSLEKEAEEYFISSVTVSQPPTGKIVLDLIKNLEYDIDELKTEGNSLPSPDDDGWLDICPEELEQMMRERYGNKSSTSDITSSLSNFLNHVSGLEGAEFPDEQQSESDTPPVRPKRGIKPRKSIPNSDAPADDDDDSNKINFDHESFSCAVQNILDFVVPDDSWDLESDESGMSSYEDESEMDLGKHHKGGQPGDTPVSELKQYMDQMDRELSTTTMGKSFHLAAPKKKGMEDSFSDIENFEPVNIDMNALKNILESYQAQMGSAGPASNMLGPMGVRLDKVNKE